MAPNNRNMRPPKGAKIPGQKIDFVAVKRLLGYMKNYNNQFFLHS